MDQCGVAVFRLSSLLLSFRVSKEEAWGEYSGSVTELGRSVARCQEAGLQATELQVKGTLSSRCPVLRLGNAGVLKSPVSHHGRADGNHGFFVHVPRGPFSRDLLFRTLGTRWMPAR